MKRKSIVTQTVWRVSTLFIFVLLSLVLLFTVYITKYMKDTILRNQQTQVEIVANSMETRLEGMIGPIISLAEYGPTARLVTEYYEPYTAKWLDNIRNIDAYLQNVSMFTNYIVDINLLSADTETVYSLNDVIRKEYDYAAQEWFQKALEQDGLVKYAPPHGTDHFYSPGGRTTFSMIYPILRSGNVIGYVMIECDLLVLADFLKTDDEESGGYLLLDEEYQPVFCSGEAPKTGQRERSGSGNDLPENTGSGNDLPEKSGSGDDLPEHTDSGDDLSDEMLSSALPGKSQVFGRGSRFYVIQRLAANGWTLVWQTGRDMILSPVFHLLAAVVALGIFTLLLLICIILRNVRAVQRPFDILIERINSYDGSGAIEIAEYDQAPRELAVIGERFEHMADKMNGLIQKVYIAELKQKEAELEALMNQINPHFLYNVFQLIQTKAVLSDNREIEDMIQALSQMMRYTMEHRQEMVKISEELDYVGNYLMFYKVRFPQLFDYEIHCPDELLACRTIKFVLQPIVENCLKHAFDRKKTGGIIRITIWREDQDLLFEVYDNGKGIGERRLREVTERLEAERYDGGIGVVNTNARIRLTCGAGYGIRMESREKEFTKVTIRVKYEG